jgi:hypothetical protein
MVPSALNIGCVLIEYGWLQFKTKFFFIHVVIKSVPQRFKEELKGSLNSIMFYLVLKRVKLDFANSTHLKLYSVSLRLALMF